VLWTGDGNSGRSITGIGFTPDVVWIKSRNSVNNHYLVDSVRGLAGGGILPSNTSAENGNQTLITNLDSDGFTVGNTYSGGANGATNGNGTQLVAWCWRAGAGTTSTNTNGSITSVVSVNQDAGFSIVSYTGTGANATVGHGLGKAPSMIICKSRDADDTWPVWHQSLASPTNNYLVLEGSAGVGTITNYWNSSAPNATTFGVAGGGYAHNLSGDKQIAYCWAEVEGFSKFGSYVGNGNADGPFVYCGFKPAWVIIKQTDGTGDWYIFDSSRGSTNPNEPALIVNQIAVETFYTGWGDFLSNGFKIRRTDSAWNGSGNSYIFAAFAESPFQTANAK
jgi:hypothetical protein